MNSKNKHHGYKVPEGYFQKQSNLLDELDSISGVEFSYKVPEGYFEQSEKNLLKLITKRPKKKIIQLIPYAASIAACLIMILLLNNPPEEINTNAFVQRYLEEQENNLTTNELLELISTDEIIFKSIVFEDFSSETIFELQQAYDPDFNLIYEDHED